MTWYDTLMALVVVATLSGIYLGFMLRVFKYAALPLRGRPHAEVTTAWLHVIVASLSVVLLFALAGGNVGGLVKSGQSSKSAVELGGLLGALTFIVSRTVAVTASPTALQSLVLSTSVCLGAILSGLLLRGGSVSDTLSDSLSAIRAHADYFPNALLLSVFATVLAEGSIRLFCHFSRRTSFAMLRSYVEGQEQYEYYQGETFSTEQMKDKLLPLAGKCGTDGETLEIRWLAHVVPDSMVRVLQALVERHAAAARAAKHTPHLRVRVIALNDTAKRNQAALQCTGVAGLESVLVHDVGMRIFMLNGVRAVVGVKVHGTARASFPDIVAVVDQPDRIAHLTSVFDTLWGMSQPSHW